MKRYYLTLLLLTVLFSAYGQNERKVIREGVRAYENGAYDQAEVQFRKAESINQESFEAEFNTGAALYGQEKYEETLKQYQKLLEKSDQPETSASIWHNIGNSLLEAQQYGPSIEAYKNSLRKNPGDEDSRYNLAYAKQKLQEQQDQQNQEQQDQQNQDQQDQQNQDKQDQQNQDKQDQQGQDKQDQQDQDKQDQQDQDKQDQQNQDQQNQQNQQNQQDQQNQDQQNQDRQAPVPREISKEDAERMLQAIQQQEKDVKDKVDKKKAAAAKIKTEKDW
jgi:Ca-activated chloride channel homolog